MERLRVIVEDSGTGGCGSGCGCAAGAADDTSPVLSLSEAAEQLSAARGPRYWKSFEELAATPAFDEMLEREFPRQAMEFGDDGVSRRRFLQLSGASLALGGLTACTRQPTEPLVPYVNQPEYMVANQAQYYATAFPLGGYAHGVLAKSHMGRPIKIEGNPDHPSSRGGTDLFAQASILSLYDPDRSQSVVHLGGIRTWADFTVEMAGRAAAAKALRGQGLRILTGNVTSPTLGAQLQALLSTMPEARWHQWEPAGAHHAARGAQRAFGAPADVHFDLSQADVVVALEADFLTQGPGAVRYAFDWSERRRVSGHDAPAGNRLYCLESMPSSTGSVADHRLALAPRDIARFAAALAAALGVPGAAGTVDGEAARWVQAVAADLRAAGARGAVVVGESLPPAVHVLAHAIHIALGAIGTAVRVTEPSAAQPVDQVASLAELTRDLQAGKVDLLIVSGVNPVFDAPADLDFLAALQKAKLRIHHGLYQDETAEYCQWHVPAAHYLESWGDARAYDGTVTVMQPLIDPLFGGKTLHEVLALFGERTDATAYQLVMAQWQAQLPGSAWAKALNDGFVPNSAAPAKGVAAVAGVAEAAAEISALPSGTEVSFRPDPTLWDGSFANNSWLQECPKPITTITWDNALLMSPATATSLGIGDLTSSDVDHQRPLVTVSVGGKSVALPVWVLPGHADGAVTVHYGHGRRRAGVVGTGAGFDVYPLRTSQALGSASASLALAGGEYPLARTQHHHSMHGRHLVRVGTVEQYKANPEFVHEMAPHVPDVSFYPPFEYKGHAWGLAVDLSSCTGCNACVVACQSENNIPTVGKEQVINGREMHWLRIDRYFEGEDADTVTGIHNQPLLCQQCEVAPCEPVCPVAATVHSEEGLNDMVYNRCVGTRYCSNNCPYKVRRFNFLKYTDHKVELTKMVRNPDVTVRMRGVMEKCTYCVQRISAGRIKSKVEAARNGGAAKIADGSIQTACQQACPSKALIFGDINDPTSEVAKRKALPLNYQLLEELGTKPRTTYLAKLRNPNPALEAARA